MALGGGILGLLLTEELLEEQEKYLLLDARS
jgi:hypothetical protein